MTKYFDFYNLERPHQSLGYRTPEMVYAAGVGGGALIMDKFTKIQQYSEVESGQRRAAA